MADPLAVIALASAAISPVVLVIVTTRERRGETRETWRRQDEVAEKAASAAKGVALAADRAASAAERVAERVAENTVRQTISEASVASQLTQIHTLVNSELMEAQRRELAALELTLMMSKEVVTLRRGRGEEPTVDAEDNLLEMEIRIKGMRDGLDAKQAETEAANAERAADQNSGVPSRADRPAPAEPAPTVGAHDAPFRPSHRRP